MKQSVSRINHWLLPISTVSLTTSFSTFNSSSLCSDFPIKKWAHWLSHPMLKKNPHHLLLLVKEVKRKNSNHLLLSRSSNDHCTFRVARQALFMYNWILITSKNHMLQ